MENIDSQKEQTPDRPLVFEKTRPYGELETAVRGLARTTMIGRRSFGIVSAEGAMVEDLMRQNELRARQSRQSPDFLQ